MSIDILKQYAPYLIAAAAGVATFWAQARNFVSYISSFVVVRSQHDEMVTRALAWHLRANYRRSPSGLYVFRSLMLPLKTSSIFQIVPFRMPSDVTAYFGRRGVFLFKAGSGNITGLRGVSKIQDLISDALDFYDDFQAQGTAASAPLIVVKVMGSMGDQFDQFKKYNESRDAGAPAPSAAGSIANSRGWNEPDLRIDRSFKYGASAFSTGANTDPFRGLFYDGIALDLVQDGVRWKENRDWYLARGIPWRRGWLLHGPGGTGKSSMAKAIAQKLRLPIYQFYLSTMNDKEFIHEWEDVGALHGAVRGFRQRLQRSRTDHRAQGTDLRLHPQSDPGCLLDQRHPPRRHDEPAGTHR